MKISDRKNLADVAGGNNLFVLKENAPVETALDGAPTCAMFAQCPRKALGGGISKVNFQETLSIFGDKCPQNGSKNEQRAPRTSMGCPHIGPSVGPLAEPARVGTSTVTGPGRTFTRNQALINRELWDTLSTPCTLHLGNARLTLGLKCTSL